MKKGLSERIKAARKSIPAIFSFFALSAALLFSSLSWADQVKYGQTPVGITASQWESIKSQIEADQYKAEECDEGLRAFNKSQNWQAVFDGTGFIVAPSEKEWSWGFSLKAYGRGEACWRIMGKAGLSSEGGYISAVWDSSLTEWWINDKKGLEHGYTLKERPSGDEVELELTMELRGNLSPRLNKDGKGLTLVNGLGREIVTYSGLTVKDSKGRNLPSRMTVSNNYVGFVVDDRDAIYPIVIDPLAQQQAYLKASNTDAADSFGYSVSVSGDTLVVGACGEASSATGVNGDPSDNSASGSGAVYVFTRSGTTWSQQAYLKASNTDAGDSFGRSVAVSGDTIVVGASNEDGNATGINGNQGDNSASNSGAAYVFTLIGGIWSQQAYLKASNTGAGDSFGLSVAVSGDTIVVGANNEDSSAIGIDGNQSDNSASNSGAAYVFVRSGTSWSQEAYLKASNTGAGDGFGDSIAVSGDTIVVGANNEDSSAIGIDGNQSDNSALNSGSAYVFVRSGTTWSQQAYLKASNTGAGDGFGDSVAVSGDTIVIGAINEGSGAIGINGNQTNENAPNSGAAYVFTRSGINWSQQAYLKASNTGAGDSFGRSVAVSGDSIVVGANTEASGSTGIDGNQGDNSASNSGSAYVFVRSGTIWSQQAYLKASNTGVDDQFGLSVSVSGDTVVMGATSEASISTGVNGNQDDNSAANAGAAYVFFIDFEPTVSFTSASQSSAGESGTMTITAQLSAASAKTVTVPFTVNASSTATGSGTDYSITASPLTIPAGSTTADITITIADDAIDENDETVIVDMGVPTNATQGAVTSHTATITDDDSAPTVSFTSASQSSAGESGTMTITAQLSAVSGKTVTVPFTVNASSTATGSGTDYSITASPLTISAGSTTADITITIADDAIDENDETVTVDMGVPTNAAQGATTSHTATITDDDDHPEINILGGSVSITDGDTTPSAADHTDFGAADIATGSVNRTFTIENTGSSALSISGTPKVVIGGANASDFTVTSDPAASVNVGSSTTFTVRFDPSSTGLKTASINITNDDSNENPYNFDIQGTGTSAPVMGVEGNSTAIANGNNSPSAADHTNFGTIAVTGSTVQRTFTIKNTGSAALNLTGATKVAVTGANSAEFTVSSQPSSPIAATSGTSTFTVTFDPAGPSTRTATLSIANDTTGTNPYTFAVSGGGIRGIIVTPTSGLTTTESVGTATFTVVLDCMPTADVTINMASSNTSEGTVSPFSLTFTVANWNTPQTVTVTGVDDSTYDGNKSYQIITSAAISQDANYNGINPSDVSVTNTDNDSAPPPPQPPDPSNPEISYNNQVIGAGTTLPNNTDHTGVTVLVGGTITNNAILTNLINSGTVSGGTISGNSGNQGLLSGVTLSAGTILNNAGGTVSGSVNNGTIFGGTISGSFTNYGILSGFSPAGTQGPSGTLTISSGSVISGGLINGSVTNLGTLNGITVESGAVISFTNGSGSFGGLSGSITFLTQSAQGGGSVPGCTLTIPQGTSCPDPGSFQTQGFEMSGVGILTYAVGHGWNSGVGRTLSKSGRSDVFIPEIPDGHALVGGIVLSETGAKSSSDMTVSIPYDKALIPDGYSEDDIKAMAYDHSENIWISVPSTRSGDSAIKLSTNLITAYALVVEVKTPPVPGSISVSQIIGNTSEDGSFATFTVVLGSAPSSDVTIGLTSSDQTEGLVSPSSLVFTPSNWNTPQTVTVKGVDDDSVDEDQPYFIVTGASVSGDPSYNGIDPSDVSVVNMDNDKGIFVPTQVSPENGALDVPMAPVLSMQEPAGAITRSIIESITGFGKHAKTKWQVSRSSDFAPFDLVFSITASTSLYSVTVPYLALTPDSTYFWRARFVDDKGNESDWSHSSKFTVVPVNPDDADNDGVADAFKISEATDLDADGTDDGSQTDMLRTRTASCDVMIALKKSTNTLAVESFISGQNTDIKTEGEPLGTVETRISVAEVGAEAEVLLYSSKAFDKSCGWKAFDIASGWYDYSPNASFSSDGKCVTVKLKDGGYGDSDGCANGKIVHKAALPKTDASVNDPEPPGSGSGGGGSCFIGSVSGSQKRLFFWFMTALVALLIRNMRTRQDSHGDRGHES
ncbi:beta strand repeat-containing protein [Desulforegula conservatrix]|uniref:beta strand repeat-containing protein n=1 Tax=Desulforegula conservatrix TaxID=153026 RepID=UPI0004170DF2|nr:choice-of-anchor D domain-containing protein [Desulforegula conservatrix]